MPLCVLFNTQLSITVRYNILTGRSKPLPPRVLLSQDLHKMLPKKQRKKHMTTATLETRLKVSARLLLRQSEQTEAVLPRTAFGSCSTIKIFSAKRFLTAALTSSTPAQARLETFPEKVFKHNLLNNQKMIYQALLQAFHWNYDTWQKLLITDIRRTNHLWLQPSRLLPKTASQILCF